jgi:hypothetical protein
VKGYIKISEQVNRRIISEFQWKEAHMDIAKFDRPTSSNIVHDFFMPNSHMQSEDFFREHTKQSAFSDGIILLNSKTRTIYFDLSNL